MVCLPTHLHGKEQVVFRTMPRFQLVPISEALGAGICFNWSTAAAQLMKGFHFCSFHSVFLQRPKKIPYKLTGILTTRLCV